jgi:DNA replication protein DnaC
MKSLNGDKVVPIISEQTVFCPNHGNYQSRNVIGKTWTTCTRCQKEESDALEAVAEQKRRQDKQNELQRRIGEACIPVRFRDRTFEVFNANSDSLRFALDFALEYANNFDDVLCTGRSAIFHGNPGTGKTHLSVAIGLYIMSHDQRTVLFSTALRMIRRVKDCWKRDSVDSESKIISLFASPDLLIVDEVGVQFGSEAERIIMFDILNERYEKRRPTIFLSNLDREGLVEFMGERVIDRLREDGGMFIAFDGESYRPNLAP